MKIQLLKFHLLMIGLFVSAQVKEAQEACTAQYTTLLEKTAKANQIDDKNIDPTSLAFLLAHQKFSELLSDPNLKFMNGNNSYDHSHATTNNSTSEVEVAIAALVMFLQQHNIYKINPDIKIEELCLQLSENVKDMISNIEMKVECYKKFVQNIYNFIKYLNEQKTEDHIMNMPFDLKTLTIGSIKGACDGFFRTLQPGHNFQTQVDAIQLIISIAVWADLSYKAHKESIFGMLKYHARTAAGLIAVSTAGTLCVASKSTTNFLSKTKKVLEPDLEKAIQESRELAIYTFNKAKEAGHETAAALEKASIAASKHLQDAGHYAHIEFTNASNWTEIYAKELGKHLYTEAIKAEKKTEEALKITNEKVGEFLAKAGHEGKIVFTNAADFSIDSAKELSEFTISHLKEGAVVTERFFKDVEVKTQQIATKAKASCGC